MKKPLFLLVFAAIQSLAGFSVLPAVRAELRLSGIFNDHVVLQREQPVSVWGWADPGRQIIVTLAEQKAAVTVAENGQWSVSLKPMKATDVGCDLSVQCDNGDFLKFKDVVVGDVWHASGQSNMAMTVAAAARRLPQVERCFRDVDLTGIRFRRINEAAATAPMDDLPTGAGWVTCSPSTVPDLSAAAFFFARELHDKVGVPIGVIDSSRGGTPIEPFIPRKAFQSHPTLRRELALGDQNDLGGIWKLPGGVRARDANWLPSRLFHSRIAPIAGFGVRGAIWYQGESNCGHGEDPRDYQHKMLALITGWRIALGKPQLPFYFVQLPGSGARAGWPYLREQQRLSCELPNAGMAVTIDLLDGNIHPPNKVDVGRRLARLALTGEYNKKMASRGPMFERAEFAKGQATVYFRHADNGLMAAIKQGLDAPKPSPKTKLSHFELADSDSHWYPATAVIEGPTVIVRDAKLQNPVAVRYAYAIDPQHCHLYNREGLPASPFCSNPNLLKYEPQIP